MSDLQTQTPTRPIGTTSLADFAQSTRDGTPAFLVNEAWHKIDPRDAILTTAEHDRRFYAGRLELGAQVCASQISLSREMRYDLALQWTELPGFQAKATAEIDTLLAEIPTVDFTKERFEDGKCLDLFTRYSLMALRAHNRASQASERPNNENSEQQRTISRAILGGIVTRATTQMEALCKMADDKSYNQNARWEILGRTFELMRFMYFVAEWCRMPDPSQMLVRVATEREDSPSSNHVTPKRSFDLVVRRGDSVYLEQDKSGGKPDDYNYAPPINVVVPRVPLVMTTRNPSRLLAAFKTLGDPKTSYRQAAAAQAELDSIIGDTRTKRGSV